MHAPPRNPVRSHLQYLTAAYGFIQHHEQAYLMEVLGSETWPIAGAYGSLTKIVICAASIVVFVAFLFALSWQITTPSSTFSAVR